MYAKEKNITGTVLTTLGTLIVVFICFFIFEKIQRNKNQETDIISAAQSNKLSGTEIFKKYSSAVFMIFTSNGANAFQGSGFFIDSNGLAVSNYHVFQGTYMGAEQIKLVGDNTPYNVVEVIAKDKSNDFILFRVNHSNTNFIPIAQERPNIGDKVYAIGSPRGLENTFSSGEVSQWRNNSFIQISTPIDHSSSGGALINEYGQVVGITSGGFDNSPSHANLNFAKSIDVVKPYLEKKN